MIASLRTLVASFCVVVAMGLAANTAAAEQWYFYVKNSTDSKMTKLLAAEEGGDWGSFDLGSGIKAGEKAKLIWSKSTNNESCEQYLKAKFADGSESKSAKIDFCSDLDDPIVFE